MYVYTDAVYRHTHTHTQVYYVRGEWHSGKSNTSLSTVGGKERKRGRKLQQPEKDKRHRKESQLHAVAADVAVGSSASKRMHEMTDCALAQATRGTQLPGSLYPDMTAVRPSLVWVFTNDVQSVEVSTGGLQSTFTNSREPAKVRRHFQRVI